MVDLGRLLSGMHKTDQVRGLDLLRKYWAARTRAHSMPEDVVRGLLQDPPLSSLSSFIALETLMARICWSKGKSKGTWRPGVAITLCAHSNVTAAFSGSYAIGNLNWATGATRCSSHTLAYLRMANLDAFWAIEPRTVAAQVREVASSVRVGRNELGLPMFGALGPWRTTMAIGRR